ncbi:MAG: hypothetical protein PF503_11925 [Desulfobacula sp.]|jgi:hypothetical protein|nr:hypothetical protein [Desulfobacula sp.]
MSRAGTKSSQGDDYQRLIAVHYLIQLLSDDRIDYIQAESNGLPGIDMEISVDDIVISYVDGRRKYIQAKKNQASNRAWSLADLKEELPKIRNQLEQDENGSVELYSRTPFGDFQSLVEASREYPCITQFKQQSGKKNIRNLEKLSKEWNRSEDASFNLLSSIKFGSHHSFEDWSKMNERNLSQIVSNSDLAIPILEKIVNVHQSKLQTSQFIINRKNVIQKLSKVGSIRARIRTLEHTKQKGHTRAKEIVNQHEVTDDLVALSISDLKLPLASISAQRPKTVSLLLQPPVIHDDPLELMSIRALEECWIDRALEEENEDCQVLGSLITSLDLGLSSNDSKVSKCFEKAVQLNVLDGKSWLFIDEQYKLCLAGYRLALSLKELPEKLGPIIRCLMGLSEATEKSQEKWRKVLLLSFRYWPEGRQILYYTGENLLPTTPKNLTVVSRLDILKQTLAYDTMLNKLDWYSNDTEHTPLSQRWAEHTGMLDLIPDIFIKLFKDSGMVSLRLRQLLQRIRGIHRYPYLKTIRFSKINTVELHNIGLAVACSLPDATLEELEDLMKSGRQSGELRCWLKLMNEPETKKVSDLHINLLKEISSQNYTKADRILAVLARKILSVPHLGIIAEK